MTRLRRILVGCTWALVAAGLIGLTAAYVRPVTFWPLAILGIMLPGIGLALLLMLPISIVSRQWLPLFAGLLVVFMILDKHASFGRLANPVATDDDLVVMSYNAPKDPDQEWAQRQVTDMVAAIKPDIIALQESVVWAMKASPDILRSHRKFQMVIDSLGYGVEMPPNGGPPSVSWTHWKPPVLLNFEPDEQQQLDLVIQSRAQDEFSVLRTVATWRGRQLAVYNFHLSSHGTSKPWRQTGGVFSISAWMSYLREIRRGFLVRERQVQRVRELVANEELPVVLVGDFNSTPDSWTYAQLGEGLQDAYRLSGSGWGATYHSRRPLVRIDFVFLGPEFEPVDAFVVDDYPRSSDHRPLVARFRWR